MITTQSYQLETLLLRPAGQEQNQGEGRCITLVMNIVLKAW